MPEPTQSEETPAVDQENPPVSSSPDQCDLREKPSEVVIEAGDMHKAEKAQLKVMLAVKDEQLAQMNLANAAQARQAAKDASDRVRQELEQKYGIDLMKCDIDEATRRVIPKRQPAIDPAFLQRLIGR